MVLNRKSKSKLETFKQQTPRIVWNESSGLRILGIYFFDDYLRTENYNWSITIQKLEKRLLGLEHRKLSLKGKVILINSTLLSKAWYVANVLPLPKWALVKIEKLIFGFLWDGRNPEPIKRQTLFMPLHKGKGDWASFIPNSEQKLFILSIFSL